MQAPVVKTPLSIIALFVALIELFLAYPVIQLQGVERLILVVFMAVFPFFVASSFFVILWHKPKNLYSPGEIAEATVIERNIAAEMENASLKEEIKRLRERAIPQEAAVLDPRTVSIQLAGKARQIAESDTKAIEAQVRSRIEEEGKVDDSVAQEIKSEIQKTRRQSKQRKAQQVQREMSKFRDWLESRGFVNLPDIPKILIEPPDFLNAYYDASNNKAHFGELISADSDTIAHTYFHVVIQNLGVLTKFEGETGALTEGYCDYYACSYNNDPYMGEIFARAAKLPTEWIRNLLDIVRLDSVTEIHNMGVIWSGACWELRERYGDEKMDHILRTVLEKLNPESIISQAASILRDEVVVAIDKKAGSDVKNVFEKRGVIIHD